LRKEKGEDPRECTKEDPVRTSESRSEKTKKREGNCPQHHGKLGEKKREIERASRISFNAAFYKETAGKGGGQGVVCVFGGRGHRGEGCGRVNTVFLEQKSSTSGGIFTGAERR